MQSKTTKFPFTSNLRSYHLSNWFIFSFCYINLIHKTQIKLLIFSLICWYVGFLYLHNLWTPLPRTFSQRNWLIMAWVGTWLLGGWPGTDSGDK